MSKIYHVDIELPVQSTRYTVRASSHKEAIRLAMDYFEEEVFQDISVLTLKGKIIREFEDDEGEVDVDSEHVYCLDKGDY